jgi:hypothetical protein
VLEPMTDVSQESESPFFFYYGPLTQKVGPNRYCGRVEKRIVRRANGKRRVLRRTVSGAPFVTTTLTVTFSAARAQ